MGSASVAIALAFALVHAGSSSHADSGPWARSSRFVKGSDARPSLAGSSSEFGAALNLRQLVGERLVVGFNSMRPPKALLSSLTHGDVAGVVLYSQNLGSRAQVIALNRELRRAGESSPLSLPPLVIVDQEGGEVRRLPGPPVRSAEEIGSTHNPSLAEAIGKRAGSYLRTLGFNVDLAPVVDVARPGSEMALEHRSFGRSPAAVSALGGAFAQGLARGGVAAVAKHFPGLGGAYADTDENPTWIRLSRAALMHTDIEPFRHLIDLGVPIVMVSNAVYPAFSSQPASLSVQIANGLLRARLHFRGVSISDDLGVPALAPYGSVPQLALDGARSGDDLLLIGHSLPMALKAGRALLHAARLGELSHSMLASSARRVLILRERIKRLGSG
ncbi:MAG: glycoside hydrolase family 3 N-terminal domain-containing protein [Solirubrobacterales bacterium]